MKKVKIFPVEGGGSAYIFKSLLWLIPLLEFSQSLHHHDDDDGEEVKLCAALQVWEEGGCSSRGIIIVIAWR